MTGGKRKSWRPRCSRPQLLVGLAILTTFAAVVARLDQAYLYAYTTKPLRGLEGWGARNVWSDALANIVLHNVSLVGAILTGWWVARRASFGRPGGSIAVAVVFLLLSALLAIRWTMLMLDKIGQP
jgi:hypothetical protein